MKSSRLLLLAALLSAGTFQPKVGFAAEGPPPPARYIGLEELRRLLSTREGVIVDARPESLYKLGHIATAINLPRYNLITEPAQRTRFPKNQLLVLYCCGTECKDADLEAKMLSESGYSRLMIFKGGMNEWNDNGLPLER
jgi:rhodanese-related sulfurtransferase